MDLSTRTIQGTYNILSRRCCLSFALLSLSPCLGGESREKEQAIWSAEILSPLVTSKLASPARFSHTKTRITRAAVSAEGRVQGEAECFGKNDAMKKGGKEDYGHLSCVRQVRYPSPPLRRFPVLFAKPFCLTLQTLSCQEKMDKERDKDKVEDHDHVMMTNGVACLWRDMMIC